MSWEGGYAYYVMYPMWIWCYFLPLLPCGQTDVCENILVFFFNEDIFVQLDDLDKMDKISHAWI